MSDATDIAADLRSDGQAMTLTRTSVGVYDDETGGISAPVVQSWTVYGITGRYKASDYNRENSLIKAGDKKATIDAITATPEPGDTLTIMGVDWKIIMIDSVSPQGVNLMHVCQVRK